MRRTLTLFALACASALCFSQACLNIDIASDLMVDNQINLECNQTPECFTLELDYPAIPNTSQYIIEPINDSPLVGFGSGTVLNITEDDAWSPTINLPFEFCFFNNTYNQLVLNDNGVVSFNTSFANQEAGYQISGANPNTNLPLNSIFGVFHDLSLDTSTIGCEDNPNTPENECGQITYQTIGQAPCRKFIINYNNITHFACPESRTSTQIVLYEGTNNIDVYINNKPLTCEYGREKEAVLGIINANGSMGYSPENRNTGIWEAANEAYRFKANGSSNPSITWYKNNSEISNQSSIQVCLTSSATYKVEVDYGCVVLTDQVNVNLIGSPSLKNLNLEFCDDPNITTIDLMQYTNDVIIDAATDNYTITYHSNATDANTGQNPINSVVEMPAPNTSANYYVRLETPSGCTAVSRIRINVSDLEDFTMPDIEVCDIGGDGQETITNLQSYLPEGLNAQIKFFETEQNAINNQNPINNIVVTASQTTLYYRATRGNCTTTGTLQIILIATPNIVDKIYESYCQPPFEAWYDLTKWEDQIANGNTGLTFEYFDENDNQIDDPTNYYSSTGEIYITVRITAPGGSDCELIATIIIENITVADRISVVEVDTDGNGQSSFNLTQTLIDYFVDRYPDIANYNFYIGPDNTLSNQSSPYTLIVTNQECTKRIRITTNHPELKECAYEFTGKSIAVPLVEDHEFELCDVATQGEEVINLQNYQSLYGLNSNCNTTINVSYHLTQTEAQNNQNPISGFQTIVNNQTIYVRVALPLANFVTFSKIKFTLTNSIAFPAISLEICDTNADEQEIYNLTQIETMITGSLPENLVKFYRTHNDALYQQNPITSLVNYLVKPESNQLYARVSQAYNCLDIITINLNFKPSIKAINHEQTVCDNDGDVNYTFDLTQSLQYMTANFASLDVSYHKTYAAADNGSQELNNPNQYVLTTKEEQIFVRFYSNITDCYSIATITLKVVSPPKLIANEYLVCDNDFDGVYDENLTNINSVIIKDPNNEFTFAYYNSFADASNQQNPIANYQNYQIPNLPKTIFVRVENQYGCSDITRVFLKPNNSLSINTNLPTIEECDDDFDGYTQFDLTQLQTQLYNSPTAEFYYYTNFNNLSASENPITNPRFFFNTTINGQVVYVRVKDQGLCDAWTTIQLQVNPLPQFTLPQELEICFGSSIIVEPNFANPNNANISQYQYLWQDANGNTISTIKQAKLLLKGTYSLTITNQFGCSYTQSLVLTYYPTPEITDVQETQTSLTIIANGFGEPLEYSIDGTNYQASNSFFNLKPGVYNVYARINRNGCQGVSTQTVLYEPNNVLTPNGDGKNDVWILNHLSFFDEASRIIIFDRYGKTVHQQSSKTQFTWDPKLLGRKLPSGAYHYIIYLPDGRKLNGNITIKNYDSTSKL